MNGKIYTFGDALIAAAILFVSNIVTLFVENPELTFGDIKQATWVSVVGGALVALLKAYNTVRMRRAMGQKSKDTERMWL